MSWQQVLELHSEPLACEAGLRDWYAQLLAQHGAGTALELAVLGGYRAASPGLAFMAGYQAALRALWPAAPLSLGALCVTEQRSTRPADLQCRLLADGLRGSKDYLAGGTDVQWLLVAARIEPPDERAQLGLYVLPSDAAGVQITAGPPLPMLPDVPHARLQLSAAAAERLPGDGWADYVKPFRSLEDLHVLTAMCAWVYGIGVRQDWPLALRLRLLAVLAGCAGVADMQLHTASGHLALAAVSAQFSDLRAPLNVAFNDGPAHLAEQWRRDQRVLDLAQVARDKRLSMALQTLKLKA